jgi:hypothetical protein
MPTKSVIPKALSKGEEMLALHLKAYGFFPEREYCFAEGIGRQWRFDFCFPKEMVAIEVEGGTKFGKSRHSRGKGYENDLEKYNCATRMGWRVYRYTTDMVKRGTAINDLLTVIFSEDL